MYLSKIKWEAGYQCRKCTHTAARLFMHKVREVMKSSGSTPIDGHADIDEFVLGGKEKGKMGRSYDSRKKKTVCAVELTQKGKANVCAAYQ